MRTLQGDQAVFCRTLKPESAPPQHLTAERDVSVYQLSVDSRRLETGRMVGSTKAMLPHPP